MCDRVTCGCPQAEQAVPTHGSCTSRSANSARQPPVCRLFSFTKTPTAFSKSSMASHEPPESQNWTRSNWCRLLSSGITGAAAPVPQL